MDFKLLSSAQDHLRTRTSEDCPSPTAGPIIPSVHEQFIRTCLLTMQIIFSPAQGAGIAQLVERLTEKPGAILTRVRVPSAARDFSPSQLPVQTLLRRPYSPCVQSLASTSERTLKIPNTGSHTIVWTHESTAHADRNAYSIALLWCLLCLTRVWRPVFPAREKEILRKKCGS